MSVQQSSSQGFLNSFFFNDVFLLHPLTLFIGMTRKFPSRRILDYCFKKAQTTPNIA